MTDETKLLEVKNLVKHFPMRSGVLSKVKNYVECRGRRQLRSQAP